MATEQIPTTLIADDAVTNAKIGADAVSTTEIANDASISTSGNIATTGSGTLTVAGASTFSGGIANSGTITAGTLSSSVVNNISVIGFSGRLKTELTAHDARWDWHLTSNYFANGVTVATSGSDDGKITIVTAGKYIMVLSVSATKVAGDINHYIYGSININGTQVSNTPALGYNSTGAGDQRMSGHCNILADLAVNDVITVTMGESGDCKTYADNASRFSMFRIGA